MCSLRQSQLPGKSCAAWLLPVHAWGAAPPPAPPAVGAVGTVSRLCRETRCSPQAAAPGARAPGSRWRPRSIAPRTGSLGQAPGHSNMSLAQTLGE